jgi:hypothetical protein
MNPIAATISMNDPMGRIRRCDSLITTVGLLPSGREGGAKRTGDFAAWGLVSIRRQERAVR